MAVLTPGRFRRTGGIAIAAAILGSAAGAALGAETWHSDRLPHAERSIRVGYWFGMSNNELLTPAYLDWLGKRCSFLIFRGMIKGPDPYFDYGPTVARIKEHCPGMPVMVYDIAQWAVRGPRIDSEDHKRVMSHPEWLIRKKDGEPLTHSEGRKAYPDITNGEYRAYFIENALKNVERYGTDGVAIDCFAHTLTPRFTVGNLHEGERIKKGYPGASAETLRGLRAALPEDKWLIFNSLQWHSPSDWPDFIQGQIALLREADGAQYEYFGRSASEGLPGVETDRFEHIVLDSLEVARAHPEKLILFSGRGPSYYTHYEEDMAVQRYCLACFLLGMTPMSVFNHHAHFQTEYLFPRRTYGHEFYEDWNLDIGAPTGAMEIADGVYFRRFQKGLAAVAPIGGGDKTLRLDRTYYTPEGDERNGRLALKDGEGAVLIAVPPPDPAPRLLLYDFEDGAPGEWKFPVTDEDTKVVEEGGARFLRARSSRKPVQPYHEARAQPTRSLTVYPKLSFRIRTTDNAGAVLVRLEVDDDTPFQANAETVKSKDYRQKEPRRPYAVVVIAPEEGTYAFEKMEKDIPYGQLKRTHRTPCLPSAGESYRADGKWHAVTVDLATSCREHAPHLTLWRVPSIRLIGEADLDDIALER